MGVGLYSAQLFFAMMCILLCLRLFEIVQISHPYCWVDRIKHLSTHLVSIGICLDVRALAIIENALLAISLHLIISESGVRFIVVLLV